MRKKTIITLITAFLMAITIFAPMVAEDVCAAPAKPSKPSGLTFTKVYRADAGSDPVDYVGFRVQWNPAKNAKKYEVKFTSKIGKNKASGSTKTTDTTFARMTDFGGCVKAQKNKTGKITVKVRAINGSKKSSWATVSYKVKSWSGTQKGE